MEVPSRFEIDDDLSREVKPLIPVRQRRHRDPGHRPRADRLVLNGILHVCTRDRVGGLAAGVRLRLRSDRVAAPAELFGVSRSGYYDWLMRAPSDRALSDAWLLEQIKRIHRDNRGVYGARRVHAELQLAEGIRVGRKRVERLMCQTELSGLARRKGVRTTIGVRGVRVADDLPSAGSGRPPRTCFALWTSPTSGLGRGG